MFTGSQEGEGSPVQLTHSPAEQRNYLELITSEIISQIFAFLGLKDRLTLAYRTKKEFKSAQSAFYQTLLSTAELIRLFSWSGNFLNLFPIHPRRFMDPEDNEHFKKLRQREKIFFSTLMPMLRHQPGKPAIESIDQGFAIGFTGEEGVKKQFRSFEKDYLDTNSLWEKMSFFSLLSGPGILLGLISTIVACSLSIAMNPYFLPLLIVSVLVCEIVLALFAIIIDGEEQDFYRERFEDVRIHKDQILYLISKAPLAVMWVPPEEAPLVSHTLLLSVENNELKLRFKEIMDDALQEIELPDTLKIYCIKIELFKYPEDPIRRDALLKHINESEPDITNLVTNRYQELNAERIKKLFNDTQIPTTPTVLKIRDALENRIMLPSQIFSTILKIIKDRPKLLTFFYAKETQSLNDLYQLVEKEGFDFSKITNQQLVIAKLESIIKSNSTPAEDDESSSLVRIINATS